MARRRKTASRDEMLGALRHSGFRVTPQRRAIIDYLDGRADHPSARQIYSGLAGRGVRLSLATVYNTLSRLVGLGMLRELQFDESYNRYDTNLETHLNLVCTTCGAITDCRGAPPVEADEILEQLGFETFTFRLEYHGVCATCRSGLRREQ